MTNPTPHGQVPEALRLAHIFDNPLPPEWPDMVAAAAELRRQHARIAELEAVGAGGVQALSAAPGVTSEQRRLIGVIADKIEDGTLFQSGIYPKKDLARFVRHMLNTTPTAPAASPTPPAEQQAQPGAVYAGLPERRRVFLCTKCGGRECESGSIHLPHPPCKCGYLGFAENLDFTEDQMRDFADRTHALRMQAATKAAPGDAIDEAMRERDDAEDFIDALLDEVLGHERPEWSNLYGRAGALNDVQERMTALHKPAVDKAWGQFQSAMAAPQQEAQEPVAWLNPWRAGKVTTDYDAYGERGIPLYTAPQPAPAPLSDDVVKDAARYRWLIDQHWIQTEVDWRLISTHQDSTIRQLDAAIDAAIAAQGGKDA